MEEHAEEELIVVEADAVGHPGTVMVHLQDAPVALRAVMAAVWLCFVTPLADSNTSELLFLHGHLEADIRVLSRTETGLV